MAEPNLLRLRFLGAPMGTLAYRPDGPFHALELEREFIATGHELSPLNLPLDSFSRGPRVFRPGDSPFDGGLPGLIADSLPDSWGARMLKIEVPSPVIRRSTADSPDSSPTLCRIRGARGC